MQNTPVIENKDRRKILLGAAALATGLASESALSSSDKGHHDHHHQKNPYTEIIDAALDCIKTGQACNDHCIQLIKAGDTTIADCMDVLAENLAMCGALAQMASYQSTHLAELAKVCIATCKDCEKECRKHEDKHEECKACAESCKECIAACKKIVA